MTKYLPYGENSVKIGPADPEIRGEKFDHENKKSTMKIRK